MANHGFGSGWFGGTDGAAGGGPFGMGGPFGFGGGPGTGGLGTGGFGTGGLGAGGPARGGLGTGDLDALARQYWSAWGEQLRAAGTPAPAAAPGWNEAIGWWSQLARGGRSESNDMLDRFNTQARGWFAQMQQLSSQFSGQDSSAADVARVWKQALGDNPFANVLQGMQGPGQQGIEQWMQQVAPLLQSMQQNGQGLLGLPTFGITREHQQRWQQLSQAQLDQQQHSKAYQALLAEAGKNAFERFEDKLAERSEPGRQLGSARALFDLWIDAAEEAYAEIALSPKFREVYGKFVNSEMRVRAGIQREIEQTCGLLGIPGRTEVDGAHRKIAQLERELRRLRDAVERGAETAAVAAQAPAPSPAAPRAASVAAKPARAGPGSAPAVARAAPAAVKPVAAKRAVAERAPVKRAAAKSVAAKPVAAPRAPAKRAVAKRVAAPSAPSPAARRKPSAKPVKSAAARAPATTAKRKR